MNAQIDEILVEVECRETNAADNFGLWGVLTKDAGSTFTPVVNGFDGTAEVGLSDAYMSAGFNNSDWGTGWTPSVVNSANFGAAVYGDSDHAGAGPLEVDHIRITVTYTLVNKGGRPGPYPPYPYRASAQQAANW